MPADKRRAPRKESASRGSSGSDSRGKHAQSPRQADERSVAMDERLAARTAVFGVLVVILAGVALWFVSATLKGRRHGERVTLTANARYTVKLGDVAAESRVAAKGMLADPDLLSIIGGHKLFLYEMSNGRVALCAGNFSSADSPEAQDLLARLTTYEPDGRHVFPSAVIWHYTP